MTREWQPQLGGGGGETTTQGTLRCYSFAEPGAKLGRVDKVAEASRQGLSPELNHKMGQQREPGWPWF